MNFVCPLPPVSHTRSNWRDQLEGAGRFYVYLHLRASDGEPFYVGKGNGKRAWERSAGRTIYWKRVVDKHGIVVRIASRWETEEDAFAHEIFLIQALRGLGAPLVNLTDGGEGSIGWSPSPEWRAKKSLHLAGNQNRRGILHSEDDKRKIGAAQRGVPKSPEHRAKIAAALRNKQKSPEHRKKLAEALLGKKRRPFTETQKLRLSESLKKSWQRRKGMQ